MKHIKYYLSNNPRYSRYKKPLEAAHVCDMARRQANGRFGVVSFRRGLLTLSVESPAAAANLNADSEKIIKELNKKIGHKAVERLRFKIN